MGMYSMSGWIRDRIWIDSQADGKPLCLAHRRLGALHDRERKHHGKDEYACKDCNQQSIALAHCLCLLQTFLDQVEAL